MTYAFTFDASACTGCKACQIACKDKNNLPVGVLWRRVYEVSGGGWEQLGDAWTTDVFAYNLSIACNHCVHPKCAGVCPTDAYIQREDGVVYIDESKCMGCGYCAWACPYSAPRYNPDLHHMTKCNFCYDYIDAGLPPACVAACPMRVLEFVEIGDQGMENSDAHGGVPPPGKAPRMAARPVKASARRSSRATKMLREDGGYGGSSILLWQLPGSDHPFPLPERSRTEPHLAIRLHSGMGNALDKTISNWEEIKTGKVKSELPLGAFTLLTQMAAGMAVFGLFSGPLSLPLLISMGGLIAAGGLVAFLHLGTPQNAWRAVFHLKKSWLSREILVFGSFGFCWFLALLFPGMGKLPLALCGIGLVYSMAQVYRLRSITAWDTNRTLLAFIVSGVLLGGLGFSVLNGDSRVGDQIAIEFGLVGALLLSLTEPEPARQTAGRFRLGLIGLALVGMVAIFFVQGTVGRWIEVSILFVALMEEVIGRWLFYEHLHRRVL